MLVCLFVCFQVSLSLLFEGTTCRMLSPAHQVWKKKKEETEKNNQCSNELKRTFGLQYFEYCKKLYIGFSGCLFFLPKPTFEPPTHLSWEASAIPGGAVGSLSLHQTIRLAVGDLVSCLVMESSAELSESLSVWSSSFRSLDLCRHFRGVSIFYRNKATPIKLSFRFKRLFNLGGFSLLVWQFDQTPNCLNSGKVFFINSSGVLMESSGYSRTSSFVSFRLFCLTRWQYTVFVLFCHKGLFVLQSSKLVEAFGRSRRDNRLQTIRKDFLRVIILSSKCELHRRVHRGVHHCQWTPRK